MKYGGKQKGNEEGQGKESEEEKRRKAINLLLLLYFPPFSVGPSVYHCLDKGILPNIKQRFHISLSGCSFPKVLAI